MRASWMPIVLVTSMAIACGKGGDSGPSYETPDLDAAQAGDADADVVDRSSALAGAQTPEDAPDGVALDLSAPPPGFLLTIDSSGVQSVGEDAPPQRSATYANVWHGVAMAAAADL